MLNFIQNFQKLSRNLKINVEFIKSHGVILHFFQKIYINFLKGRIILEVKLIDLKRQYDSIKDEILGSVSKVLESGNYILGPNVSSFEKEFAEYVGTSFAVGVANGTDALVMSLKALGIGPGDEVITSPFTFFASAECISQVGAKPVFADVCLDTYNIDPKEIEKKITDRTKAIIPVHIFGNPCNMDEIMNIAKKYNLYVVEDACQAVGAAYKGRRIGTFGDVACFSFFPTKNLGCFGDGGMVVTNDKEIAEKVRLLRMHGSPKKYYHDMIGFNSRLDEIQAAILRVKLKFIDQWNQMRIERAKLYDELLENTVKTPKKEKDARHVYHLYSIVTEKRDLLKEELEKRNIGCGIYYPLPLHLQNVYKDLGYKKGDFPNAEYLSENILSIPMFPELTHEELTYVAEAVREILK